MFVKSSLVAGLMAVGAMASTIRSPASGNLCGAPKPSAEHLKMSAQLAQIEQAARLSGEVSTQAVISVDTYFHVVATSTSASDGYLTVSPTFPLPSYTRET